MTFKEFYSQPKYKKIQVEELNEWEDPLEEDIIKVLVPLTGLKNLAREAYNAGHHEGYAVGYEINEPNKQHHTHE